MIQVSTHLRAWTKKTAFSNSYKVAEARVGGSRVKRDAVSGASTASLFFLCTTSRNADQFNDYKF
jgi:hypothetical protein